jgi:hypothetical protein
VLRQAGTKANPPHLDRLLLRSNTSHTIVNCSRVPPCTEYSKLNCSPPPVSTPRSRAPSSYLLLLQFAQCIGLHPSNTPWRSIVSRSQDRPNLMSTTTCAADLTFTTLTPNPHVHRSVLTPTSATPVCRDFFLFSDGPPISFLRQTLSGAPASTPSYRTCISIRIPFITGVSAPVGCHENLRSIRWGRMKPLAGLRH